MPPRQQVKRNRDTEETGKDTMARMVTNFGPAHNRVNDDDHTMMYMAGEAYSQADSYLVDTIVKAASVTNPILGQILPWKFLDNPKYRYETRIFNPTMLGIDPEGGVPGLVSMCTKTKSGKLTRFGLGLLVSHEAMWADKHDEELEGKLSTIVVAFHETCNWLAIQALLNAEDKYDSIITEQVGKSNSISAAYATCQTNAWGLVNTDESGIHKVIGMAMSLMDVNRVKPDMAIVPQSSLDMTAFGAENSTVASFVGDAVRDRQCTYGGGAVVIRGGIQAHTLRKFLPGATSTQARDPLSARKVIGEFAIIPSYSILPGEMHGPLPGTGQTGLFDCGQDKFVTMDWDSVLTEMCLDTTATKTKPGAAEDKTDSGIGDLFTDAIVVWTAAHYNTKTILDKMFRGHTLDEVKAHLKRLSGALPVTAGLFLRECESTSDFTGGNSLMAPSYGGYVNHGDGGNHGGGGSHGDGGNHGGGGLGPMNGGRNVSKPASSKLHATLHGPVEEAVKSYLEGEKKGCTTDPAIALDGGFASYKRGVRGVSPKAALNGALDDYYAATKEIIADSLPGADTNATELHHTASGRARTRAEIAELLAPVIPTRIDCIHAAARVRSEHTGALGEADEAGGVQGECHTGDPNCQGMDVDDDTDKMFNGYINFSPAKDSGWYRLIIENVAYNIIAMGTFDIAVYRMGSTWQTAGAMFVESGSELGATLIANPNGQGGHNPQEKRSFYHFTAWLGVDIKDEEKLVYFPDVFVTKYEGGCDVTQHPWSKRAGSKKNVRRSMKTSNVSCLMHPISCGLMSKEGISNANTPISLDGKADVAVRDAFMMADDSRLSIVGSHESGPGVKTFMTDMARLYDSAQHYTGPAMGQNQLHHLMCRPFCRLGRGTAMTGLARQQQMMHAWNMSKESNRPKIRGAPTDFNKICHQGAQQTINPVTRTVAVTVQQRGHWPNAEQGCMNNRTGKFMAQRFVSV